MQKAVIQIPSGVRKIIRKHNLGSELEILLDVACEQYSNRGIASIHKIPTPLKIIGATERGLLAVPKEKSIVDYIGEFQGIPICNGSQED